MAPGIISDHTDSVQNGNGVHSKTSFREQLKLSGNLDKFEWEDTTPVIGREFPTLNIVDDLLNAGNADELVRDLAITSKCLLPTTQALLYSRYVQSPNAASSSSVPKTTSQTKHKNG